MRLFVGLELPEQVRAAVGKAAAALASRLSRSGVRADVRWVVPANLHVTIWFIGDVADERGEAVVAALAPPYEAARFPLAVEGLGAFPASGPPRILWAGVRGDLAALTALHGVVEQRLVGLGFEPDQRPYSAHVTVGRARDVRGSSGRRLRELLAEAAVNADPFTVAAVTVFRSRPSQQGSQYEPLLRVPLS
jgi:2'-5' RNA ligase